MTRIDKKKARSKTSTESLNVVDFILTTCYYLSVNLKKIHNIFQKKGNLLKKQLLFLLACCSLTIYAPSQKEKQTAAAFIAKLNQQFGGQRSNNNSPDNLSSPRHGKNKGGSYQHPVVKPAPRK